jgi:hypothetical protein
LTADLTEIKLKGSPARGGGEDGTGARVPDGKRLGGCGRRRVGAVSDGAGRLSTR